MGRKLALELKRRDLIVVDGVTRRVRSVEDDLWSQQKLIVRFTDGDQVLMERGQSVETR